MRYALSYKTYQTDLVPGLDPCPVQAAPVLSGTLHCTLIVPGINIADTNGEDLRADIDRGVCLCQSAFPKRHRRRNNSRHRKFHSPGRGERLHRRHVVKSVTWNTKITRVIPGSLSIHFCPLSHCSKIAFVFCGVTFCQIFCNVEKCDGFVELTHSTGFESEEFFNATFQLHFLLAVLWF